VVDAGVGVKEGALDDEGAAEDNDSDNGKDNETGKDVGRLADADELVVGERVGGPGRPIERVGKLGNDKVGKSPAAAGELVVWPPPLS